jgi:hypothetical protein
VQLVILDIKYRRWQHQQRQRLIGRIGVDLGRRRARATWP